MNNFPIVATVISMVLGLGVTRLLMGLVTVFRIRRTAAMDWVPLVWTGILFLMQLQFWWAINGLSRLQKDFSFAAFVFLVLLTMMLFLSAALLLPSRNEDEARGLRHYHETDGRYGLLTLAAFLVLGFAANEIFFGQKLSSLSAMLDIPMIILPVAAFLARPRRFYSGIALIYVPLMLLDTYVALTS